MSEEDAGNRLRALVKAVADDLWIAAATFEVYAPTAFDASLIEKVNEREVYPAFNVVSEALEATAISALCRQSGTRRATRPASPRSRSCSEDGLTLLATAARFGDG